MRRLVLCAAIVTAVATPATAYAGNGHGGGGGGSGGGGGGGAKSVTVSITSATANEYAGTHVVVTRSSKSGTGSVLVTPSSGASDTAVAGTDYDATARTATFGRNQTTAAVDLPPGPQDADLEDAKTFTVSLSNPSAGLAVSATAGSRTVTLADDDFDGPFSLPDHTRIDVTGISLGGCDILQGRIDGDISAVLGSSGGCGSSSTFPYTFTNTTGGPLSFTVDLEDGQGFCGITYSSDGNTTPHHASVVTGSGAGATTTYTVRMMDCNGGTSRDTDRLPSASGDTGNFVATVTLTPVP